MSFRVLYLRPGRLRNAHGPIFPLKLLSLTPPLFFNTSGMFGLKKWLNFKPFYILPGNPSNQANYICSECTLWVLKGS